VLKRSLLLTIVVFALAYGPPLLAQEGETEGVQTSILNLRPGDYGTVILMLNNCSADRGIEVGTPGYFPDPEIEEGVELTGFVGANRCEAVTEVSIDVANSQNYVIFGERPPPPGPILVRIEGSPSRADVDLGDEEVCDGLPCEFELPEGEGPVEVVVSRRHYRSQTLTLEREPDRVYQVELERR
jgi:hypothetical protein